MMLHPNKDGLLDIVMVDNAIVNETSFETVLLTSLLLNRRVDPDDTLPYQYKNNNDLMGGDRQGWVCDFLDEGARKIGSKLWLLDQELATDKTRKRAVNYIHQALKWSIDEGYVSSVRIETEKADHNRYNLQVDVYLTSGDVFSLRVNYKTGVVYVL